MARTSAPLARPVVLLAGIGGLAAGLVLGLSGGAVLGGEGDAPVLAAPSAGAAPALGRADATTTSDPDRIEAANGSERRGAAAIAPAPPPATERRPAAAPTGPLDDLLTVLRRRVAAGRIDVAALRGWMQAQALEAGDFEDVWKLTPDDLQGLLSLGLSYGGYWGGTSLGGEPAAQREFLETLLSRASGLGLDDETKGQLDAAVLQLMALDPVAGNAWADRLGLEISPAMRAAHYLQAGMDGPARDLLLPLLLDPEHRDEALGMLDAGSPETREALLRGLVAQGVTDDSVLAGLCYALLEQDRPAEALDLIEGLRTAGNPALLANLIGQLPEEVLAARAADWVPTDVDPNAAAWMMSAIDTLAGSEHGDVAVDLQVRLLEGVAGGTAAPQELSALTPELCRQNRARLEPALRAAEPGVGVNDELWGDMAQVYAAMGLMEDALRCVEHAAHWDPFDPEWPPYLESLHAGKNPWDWE